MFIPSRLPRRTRTQYHKGHAPSREHNRGEDQIRRKRRIPDVPGMAMAVEAGRRPTWDALRTRFAPDRDGARSRLRWGADAPHPRLDRARAKRLVVRGCLERGLESVPSPSTRHGSGRAAQHHRGLGRLAQP